MKTNNGGPAFPNPSGDDRDNNGMTLRDWFAGQDSLEEFRDIPVSVGVVVAGPCPKTQFEDDPLAWLDWWALVRARLKYLRADAMLKAREVQS